MMVSLPKELLIGELIDKQNVEINALLSKPNLYVTFTN
jgi:hypothetical protein